MNKFFLQSKTILGAIIVAAGAFGYVLPFTSEESEEFMVLAEKLLGLVLIVWGRITATKPLGFK